MIPHPINFKLSGGCSWLKYLIIAKVFNGLSLCPHRLGKYYYTCFADENTCPGFVLHCFNEVCFLLLFHPVCPRQRGGISRSRREHHFFQTELGMDLGLDAFLGVPYSILGTEPSVVFFGAWTCLHHHLLHSELHECHGWPTDHWREAAASMEEKLTGCHQNSPHADLVFKPVCLSINNYVEIKKILYSGRHHIRKGLFPG